MTLGVCQGYSLTARGLSAITELLVQIGTLHVARSERRLSFLLLKTGESLIGY